MENSKNQSCFPVSIFNHYLPVGSANVLLFASPPATLPAEYGWLQECGSGWVCGQLIEVATGFVRYVNSHGHPTGSFLTDLRDLKAEEAVQRLKLPEQNKALYEYRAKILPNTFVFVGKIPDSEDHQLFIPQKELLEFYDPKKTYLNS